MDAVQAALAGLFARLGLVPRQVQTDRGGCFLGAEGGERAAVPSRLTLWLAGLGIDHRLIPPRCPQRNGAVERFHGGVEYSWTGEADGLEALRVVWNVDKAPVGEGHRPYPGRGGFEMARVWALLGQARVTRQVSRQGTISLWDRAIYVGRSLSGQEVTLTVDASAQRLIVADRHEAVVASKALSWLTAEWLWAPVSRTDHAAHTTDTPIFR